VLADGKVAVAIYERGGVAIPPELRWFWSITEIAPAVPNITYGHAATREEAMEWNRNVQGSAPIGIAAACTTSSPSERADDAAKRAPVSGTNGRTS
jgi:hypothetical protein